MLIILSHSIEHILEDPEKLSLYLLTHWKPREIKRLANHLLNDVAQGIVGEVAIQVALSEKENSLNI